MKQIIQQVGGQKKLDKLLKQQSVTQAQLEDQLKAQMLQDAVQQKVYAGIKVSQADIEKYFNTPANKSQFNVAESVDARHILVKTKAEADKVRALLEADNSDANWKKVAKEYSTDTGSKNNGGSLGNFPKGRMVKPFEDAAFALKVNEISQPVKSQFGYHVIEVTKKTPGSKQTLEQAKATIEQQLKYQKQSTAWETWLKDAMAAAGVAYAAGLRPGEPHGLSEPGRFGLAASPRRKTDPSGARRRSDEPHARVHRRRRRTGARSIAAGPLRRRRRLRPGRPRGRAPRARRRGRRPRLRPPARARPCRRRRAGRPRPPRRRRRDRRRARRPRRAAAGARAAAAGRLRRAAAEPRRTVPAGQAFDDALLGQELVSLKRIVDVLRVECPWDREQTPQDIVGYTVEEVHELADAIAAGDLRAEHGELGDLLLQVVLLALMLNEEGAGDLASVAHDIEVKLIRRHPHIFADAVADTPADVKSRWERIKVEQEGREGIFHDVPAGFPALLYAKKLQQRAASVGFDWDSAAEAFPKIAEEHAELAELFAEAAVAEGAAAASAAADPRCRPAPHRPARGARGRRPALRHGQRRAPAARGPGARAARGRPPLRAPRHGGGGARRRRGRGLVVARPARPGGVLPAGKAGEKAPGPGGEPPADAGA